MHPLWNKTCHMPVAGSLMFKRNAFLSVPYTTVAKVNRVSLSLRPWRYLGSFDVQKGDGPIRHQIYVPVILPGKLMARTQFARATSKRFVEHLNTISGPNRRPHTLEIPQSIRLACYPGGLAWRGHFSTILPRFPSGGRPACARSTEDLWQWQNPSLRFQCRPRMGRWLKLFVTSNSKQ